MTAATLPDLAGAGGLTDASTTNAQMKTAVAALRAWSEAAAGATVDREALGVTGAYTLLASDNLNKVRITGSATFTLGASAGATLGNGWMVYLRHEGTGVVTLDPNGTETVDGATTLVIPPGSSGILYSDGSNLYTIGIRSPLLAAGECRLVKSGSDLVLQRHKGRFITINGVNYEIPSAGVTCVPTSNTADTTYYIYAYISSGAIALEYSATGHSTHTDGTEIKTGDATRVLVGMARSGTSGGTWTSVGTELRSWFNRGAVSATIKKSGSNLSCTSSSLAEVSSAFRGGFVCWADDVVNITLASTVGVSTTTTYSNMSLYVDGADWTALPSIQQDYDTTSASYDRRTSGSGSLSEGHHTAQLWALVTAAHTFTLLGGDFTRFQIEVRG